MTGLRTQPPNSPAPGHRGAPDSHPGKEQAFGEKVGAVARTGMTAPIQKTIDQAYDAEAIGYDRDPLLVFQNWWNWLKPGGQVVIVDGLWFRDGWKDDDLVDQLPISCLQTRATIAYLLEKSGFQVCHNRAETSQCVLDWRRTDQLPKIHDHCPKRPTKVESTGCTLRGDLLTEREESAQTQPDR